MIMQVLTIIVATILVFSIAIPSQDVAEFQQSPKVDTIHIHDTIYKEVDTMFVFCKDSEFLKALTNTETNNNRKLEKGYPLSNKIDASGEYYGIYQISEGYLKGNDLANFLQYGIDDMLDPKKATIAVVAKTIDKIRQYKKEFGKIPTLSDLARIHSAGYTGAKKGRGSKYVKEFESNLLGNDSLK